MKKNYLKIALVSAFAMAAGYNVYSSQEEVKLSEMALENIEALARDESLGGYTRSSGQCPDPIRYKTWVSCQRGGSEECYPSDC